MINPKQPVILFESAGIYFELCLQEFHLVWFWYRVVSIDLYSLFFYPQGLLRMNQFLLPEYTLN